MVVIFLTSGLHYTIDHVESVRLVGMSGTDKAALYTIEVKCFGNASTLHAGIKGWIFSCGTHELKG